jgi:hypothetical protein
MPLLTSKKRTKGLSDDHADDSAQVAALEEAASALPDELASALDDASGQLADHASELPEAVGDVLYETSSDLADAASALPDSFDGAGGSSSDLAAAGAALPDAVESVLADLSDLAEELPDGQAVELPADQLGRLAAARAAAVAATSRTARSAREAAANQAKRQAHAAVEAGREAGHQAAETARMQGQVAAEAVQRQLDSALDSARESAEHLREAVAHAPVVQKVSPKARRRAAELEQARLRAASRRRVTLLVLLGAGVVGAVALYLKRRAATQATDQGVDAAEGTEAPEVLVVEETVITTVDLGEGPDQATGAVRSTDGDSPGGSTG